ncbi:MAG: hypothetical protein Q8P92_05810 [Candidatus Daviesbacteria bacterium]|nr:hypothetical protein [Candidatus Daviesbacteria bacterium]
MIKFLPKLLLPLIFWGSFIYVVLQIPYPESFSQASPQQLLYFFVSLFFAITLTLNIFLNFILLSASVAIGIILLLILRAMEFLNIVTTIMVLIAVGLLFSYFGKIKGKKLTLNSKIPKLTHLRRSR